MQIYGLVGHPLGHSFSKQYFNTKFENEGVDARYENFDLESVTNLRTLIAERPDIAGLNVTIPYKRDVLSLMDELSDDAREIGAVNVICIDRSNGLRLIGHNTDCIGFGIALDSVCLQGQSRVASAEDSGTDSDTDSAYSNTDSAYRNLKALILGTGGASAAVAQALRVRGIDLKFVSRSGGAGRLTYEELHRDPTILHEYKLVINTTPLGTYPKCEGRADIPYDRLTGEHLCMDLVYNPAVTQFMAAAAAQGACVKNGLMMLHEQARAAWRLWQSTKPE